MPELSIVIPAYNEARTIARLLERVLRVSVPGGTEIIVVDDGSHDETPSILASFGGRVRVLTHPKNRGKGAGVRTGFAHAQGKYVVVQDADLEYDPEDLREMLDLANRENAQAVYGSRRLPPTHGERKRGALRYYLGGVILTGITNLLYGTRITDEPTCYKMIERSLLERIPLSSEGFEFCPEITAKIARLGIPIYEVPISYDPRSSAEGKKIRAKDGIIAIWTLAKYRVLPARTLQK